MQEAVVYDPRCCQVMHRPRRVRLVLPKVFIHGGAAFASESAVVKAAILYLPLAFTQMLSRVSYSTHVEYISQGSSSFFSLLVCGNLVGLSSASLQRVLTSKR